MKLDFSVTMSVPFSDAGWPCQSEWRTLTDKLFRFPFGLMDDSLLRWFDDRVECRILFQLFGNAEENAARSSAIFQKACSIFVPLPYDFRIVPRAKLKNGKWVEVGIPFSRNKYDHPLSRSESSRETDE